MDDKEQPVTNSPKILIVDDDRALQIALVDAFESNGFIVTTASSGEEGLEIVSGQSFDIIVLDLILGKVTGIDMLKEVRSEILWGKYVPIIILSSVAFLREMELVKELASRYIFKGDFEVSDLVKTARMLLQKG